MAVDKVYVYGEEMAKSQDLQEISGSIPNELSDLQDDSEHRTVTDDEKTYWNNKSDFSGSYNDLTDTPVIPDNNWSLLGTITNVGNADALNIPNGAKELNIEVFADSFDGVSMNILTSNLTSNNKGYNSGFYKTSQDNMRILIYANSSQIWVQEIIKNSSSKSTTYSCSVYYR